ncbi:class I SAM-dependent methyltransferase [Streptomyces yunnanensis]|uniref:Class I SAM-dependent methyltransferase n=1 Tax=Streptomyces yunnanensis TaxID=156453 RepID=A0ABY8AMY5_9ACTN|nr:methyltransferase domain-containing protein [Streptomyces yunnanensis]WEB44862.1 class I SAM-dependent methyltransferase [Streptomyces yunnanensis]
MTKQPTNDAAIQQWNRIPREALEAMEPDGDFAERHLINPVPLHMLGDVRGRRVLDAGCGHGYFSRMLAARGTHVTGVEPTDGMFSYAREKPAQPPDRRRTPVRQDVRGPGRSARVVRRRGTGPVAGPLICHRERVAPPSMWIMLPVV